jgi:hypothetical protein
MELQRIDTLEQTVQGCLTQAALFRQYLTDEENTSILQEEYDGFRQMLATVFQEIFTLARALEEEAVVNGEECDRLLHKIDPHLY